MLGRAYFELGDYESATKNFDKAESINSNGLRKFYIYKGLANLELNKLDRAVQDLGRKIFCGKSWPCARILSAGKVWKRILKGRDAQGAGADGRRDRSDALLARARSRGAR